MSRFYLTTAIDYVNSRPHLGTAYEKIAADVIARYKRLCGIDTHFVMGNDEHSQNVFRKARELGEDPLAYCDRMAGEFIDVWQRLDISYDDFIRTTEPRHKAGVQELVRRMSAAGDIFEGDYEGWYCVSCEATGPSRSGFAKRTTSFVSQNIPRSFVSISNGMRNSWCQRSGATRFFGCSRRDSKTFRSAAPARRGGSPCPTIPRA